MWTKFKRDEKGFTGLEAAIVLIAFVVVAAVFSYVMLGAGFFTTQKSQEVVHTGVTQATSSVELSGDVLAHGDTTVDPKVLTDVVLFLQQTAGGSPVDMSKTLITYTDPATPPVDLVLPAASVFGDVPITAVGDTSFGIGAIYNDNSQNNLLIEKGEKFEVTVDLSAEALEANDEFELEIKPPSGASYSIHRKVPPSIEKVMALN